MFGVLSSARTNGWNIKRSVDDFVKNFNEFFVTKLNPAEFGVTPVSQPLFVNESFQKWTDFQWGTSYIQLSTLFRDHFYLIKVNQNSVAVIDPGSSNEVLYTWDLKLGK